METSIQPELRARHVARGLHAALQRRGQLAVVAGAPRTGKTTLARTCFPDYAYIDLNDSAMRTAAADMGPAAWRSRYPRAVIDGAERLPGVFETVAHTADVWPEVRYVAVTQRLGQPYRRAADTMPSAQWPVFSVLPMTLPELRSTNGKRCASSLFQHLLRGGKMPALGTSFADDPDYPDKRSAWHHLVEYGGLPELLSGDMRPSQRRQWLADFVTDYIQRDARYLSSVNNVEGYGLLMRYLGKHTGGLLTKTKVGRYAGTNVSTVERFINSLCGGEMGFLLPSWEGDDPEKTTKAPRFYYYDPGVVRGLTDHFGPLSDSEFTSLVVAEIRKQSQQCGTSVRLHHLRTQSGRELDVLLELPQGYIGVKVVLTTRAMPSMARHLYGLETLLDKPVLHNFLVSADERVYTMLCSTTALHAAHLLG